MILPFSSLNPSKLSELINRLINSFLNELHAWSCFTNEVISYLEGSFFTSFSMVDNKVSNFNIFENTKDSEV